jgi:hypothetical protein
MYDYYRSICNIIYGYASSFCKQPWKDKLSAQVNVIVASDNILRKLTALYQVVHLNRIPQPRAQQLLPKIENPAVSKFQKSKKKK